MRETTWNRWLIATIVGLAIFALLAWARNDPGVDDRDPDPPASTELVDTEDSVPPRATTAVTDPGAVPPTT